MKITSILPVIAVAIFLIHAFYTMMKKVEIRKMSWIVPTILSAMFLLFTIQTIYSEGLFGFWREHIRNLWGNQIWFDLLLAIGIGWFLIVPEARKVGMKVWPWLVLIICSGCIGLLAMVARLIYLKEKQIRKMQKA